MCKCTQNTSFQYNKGPVLCMPEKVQWMDAGIKLVTGGSDRFWSRALQGVTG